MRAFVITVSTAPSRRVRCDCPIPSRITFPPPNFTSSPYSVKSFSTSIIRSVSARRTLSPTVGPNICAYAARFIVWGIRLPHWSHDSLVETINQPRALIRDQRNFARLPRFETHCRSRGNVQTTPKSSLPIKRQSRVGLGEMIVTAHLDRPVTRVGDRQRDGGSIFVQDDLARCWKYFARYHVSPRSKQRRPTL